MLSNFRKHSHDAETADSVRLSLDVFDAVCDTVFWCVRRVTRQDVDNLQRYIFGGFFIKQERTGYISE